MIDRVRRTAPLVALAAATVTLAGAIPTATAADVRPDAGMLQYPDVGPEHIVFVYANDLWLVDRAGGQATPLASPPGMEFLPKFNDDGSAIVFAGNYDGGRDLYTVGPAGGLPSRLTHHPALEVPCGWTPDGDVLFYASGIQGMPRASQLFTVSAEGGLPEKLPVPYGAAAAISPEGTWLAYTPYTRDQRTWKRYRGGMASDIWLLNLDTLESRRATDWEGTDTLPMWHGDTLYFLSDAGPAHKLNLWKYDMDSGVRTQVTEFDEYDVKWPSVGPGDRGQGEIVFQNGSSLYLLDLATGEPREVHVTIPGARPTIRPQHVDASKQMQWWHISATGKRALVAARGDLWTLPAEHGSPRNLTRTSGVAERQPSWSPDGRWIAYFSDESGEYELYVTQSDGKGETKRLTTGSETFYSDPVWSPDSKHIAYSDKAGRIYLTTVETSDTTLVDEDPWGSVVRPSWSHDSRWLTYSRSDEQNRVPSIRLYEVETGEHTQVTSGVFSDTSPVFDRTGEYLYFTSARQFNPTYSDLDTTFVYNQSGVLLAVPLDAESESPWLPESDEEKWSDEDEEEDEDEDKEDADDDGTEDEEADDDGEDKADEADEDEETVAPTADDGVSGTWEGTVSGGEFPPGLEFVMTLSLSDGIVTGSVTVPMGSGTVEGVYDAATGELTGEITTEEGAVATFTGRITGSSMTLTVSLAGQTIDMKGERTSGASEGEGEGDAAKAKAKAKERVEIDVEGFEARAIMLPVPAGNFGNLAVNDKNQLLYTRMSPAGAPSIMLFDITDDKKEEKTVAKGAGGFEISGDGKKLCISRGGSVAIQNAAAGATSKNVVTTGMNVVIDPREEWKQLVRDAWRIQRDFFYVDNLHGVDWLYALERAERMLDDCTTREDVGYVIREMISELNIGHAYYASGNTGEEELTVPVGMLGVDWELADGAYRVARVVEGAAWDVDARNPLRQRGLDVEVGDYILAVNGVPLDTSKDPWAAFLGTAGRTITLTVSEKPEIDDDARVVAVKPIASESALRYRAWIEANRAYVEDRSDGQVGYIYVPNTGVNGQNDLVRQYVGQTEKKALVIDERWNGGGQIPTRFIEMLNRPVTNYWARRHGQDAKWPPDAHHGPKCMLINGRAGSGGDMFPYLFRQAGLGKLIGTRTWGGLVGISGNPGLIDGSRVTVPTFGFYEVDGTWGVEGHGVDPDLEVIDDPALMVDGGDPQLDVAIDLMLDEIEQNAYAPPGRPVPPDRSGMGIRDEDK